MYIFAGLGNPGKKFDQTRHNMGHMALEAFAQQHEVTLEENKLFDALYWKGTLKEQQVILALPQTYMNESGKVIGRLLREHPDAHVVLLCDDIDIALGSIKCSFARGAGGHNGVQSVIDTLGTNEFFRIRMGVRPVHEELLPRIAPPDGFEKFLLSNFTPLEAEKLKEGIEKAVNCATYLLTHTREETMQEWNEK